MNTILQMLMSFLFENRELIFNMILALFGWNVGSHFIPALPGPVQTVTSLSRRVRGASAVDGTDPVLTQIGEKAKSAIDAGDIRLARKELDSYDTYKKTIIDDPATSPGTSS